MRLVFAVTAAIAAAAVVTPTALAKDITAASSDATIQIDGSPWPDVNMVKAYFRAGYQTRCDSFFSNEDLATYQPQVWDLTFNYSYEREGDPVHPLTLYQFGCTSGAYNFGDIYLMVREWDGIQPVSFAQPELTFDYDGLLDMPEGVRGYTSTDILINSGFDPDLRQVSDFSKWRGLGDASSSGIWELVEDRFVLRYYEVDATYDEQINPLPIVDWRPTN